jgi:hypothetical protein
VSQPSGPSFSSVTWIELRLVLRLEGRRWKVDGLSSATTLRRVPKVFEKDGSVFFFYSNDHEPIHVHVRYVGGEAVFVVEPSVELRESSGMGLHDLRRAQELAEQNKELIVRKWHEHLG